MANIVVQTENFSGSDASGSDAGENRVITLNNRNKTVASGFQVAVSGSTLSSSDYTVSHTNTSTTITLINRLWDDQKIRVTYYQIDSNVFPEDEDHSGSDATGTDGGQNRVLTLDNTSLSSDDDVTIFVDGLMLHESEFIYTPNSSGSTIKFLNALFDSQSINVIYFLATSVSGKRLDIYTIFSEHAISGTLIRTTETTDSLGGVTAASTTSYNITIMMQDITREDRQIIEQGLAIPGNVKAFFKHSYPSGETGQVGNLVVNPGDIFQESGGKKWMIQQIIGERYIDSQELFRVGVLRNINLEP